MIRQPVYTSKIHMICGFGKTRTLRVTSPADILKPYQPTNPGTCLETVSQAVRTWRFTRVDGPKSFQPEKMDTLGVGTW